MNDRFSFVVLGSRQNAFRLVWYRWSANASLAGSNDVFRETIDSILEQGLKVVGCLDVFHSARVHGSRSIQRSEDLFWMLCKVTVDSNRISSQRIGDFHRVIPLRRRDSLAIFPVVEPS